MTNTQLFITAAVCSLGTILTRFLPFMVFSSKRPAPKYVHYLGKALPPAVFGMLLVYCLKDVSLMEGSRGLPELLSIVLTAVLHIWRRNMLLSVAAGTLSYMLLVQTVF